jgi:hypothetical protein
VAPRTLTGENHFGKKVPAGHGCILYLVLDGDAGPRP